MKKIIIHVGSHKTGSTAIQTFLSKNRKELRKKGVVYPENACPEIAKFGHHMIPWAFVTNEQFLPSLYGEKCLIQDKATLFEKVKSECKTDETMILSSEEFSTLTKEEVCSLKEWLSDFNVEIILYLRRQDKYLESAYKTSVLSGSINKNIKEFCKNQRLNLNYLELIETWEDVFENVTIRSYDNSTISDDIVGDFLGLINLSEIHEKNQKELANPSLNAEVIEVIRALRLRKEPESNIEVIKNNAILLSLGNKTSTFLTTDLYNSIKDAYSSSNEIIHKKYNCNLNFDEHAVYTNSINSLEQCLFAVFKELIVKDI
jgi:hypothetical protein